MNRRSLLLGLLAAPAVIRTPGLLMPVKPWALSGDAFAAPLHWGFSLPMETIDRIWDGWIENGAPGIETMSPASQEFVRAIIARQHITQIDAPLRLT